MAISLLTVLLHIHGVTFVSVALTLMVSYISLQQVSPFFLSSCLGAVCSFKILILKKQLMDRQPELAQRTTISQAP
jgi:hypothetical protein